MILKVLLHKIITQCLEDQDDFSSCPAQVICSSYIQMEKCHHSFELLYSHLLSYKPTAECFGMFCSIHFKLSSLAFLQTFHKLLALQ